MKNLITFGLASSALLIGTIQAQAATFVDTFGVDPFDNGEEVLDVLELEVTEENVSDSGFATHDDILGGERDVLLEFTPPEPGAATVKINLEMREDFRHNNEVDVASVATVTYDGVDDNGLGGGAGYNLLTEGSKFTLDILAIDLTAQLGISLMDINGDTDSIVYDGLEEGIVEFDFSDFNDVDLSRISTITFQSTSFNSEDLRADTLLIDGTPNPDPDTENPNPDPNPDPETTPEPATLLGLLFSLTCGALFKKKK